MADPRPTTPPRAKPDPVLHVLMILMTTEIRINDMGKPREEDASMVGRVRQLATRLVKRRLRPCGPPAS
jgi:hypothetical protein